MSTQTHKRHPKQYLKRIRSAKKFKNKGKSHLASVRIVGNKAYNTRRATSYYDDDKVRNDVNLLSYYSKNRKAAESKEEPKVRLESGRCSSNENNVTRYLLLKCAAEKLSNRHYHFLLN